MPPDVERKAIEEAKRFNEPLPEKIQNKPRLFLGLELFFNAWFELSFERNSATEAIKRSSVFEYAYDYGFSEEQTDDLWFYIRQMDNEHLKRVREKMPKPTKSPTKQGFK